MRAAGLFAAQRDERVDSRGAPRRQIPGEDSNHQQERHRRKDGRGIVRLQSEHQALDERREREDLQLWIETLNDVAKGSGDLARLDAARISKFTVVMPSIGCMYET